MLSLASSLARFILNVRFSVLNHNAPSCFSTKVIAGVAMLFRNAGSTNQWTQSEPALLDLAGGDKGCGHDAIAWPAL